MFIRAEKTYATRLRRALLAIGTASAAMCIADPAMAACVIAPGGTGTVANPGPNSTVVCTGTTNGINVAGTNPGSEVQIEGGAEVIGVAGSEIFLNGSGSHVIVGGGATSGPATLRDTSVSVFGDGARLDIIDGSLVDQTGNAAALLMVNGANASIGIGAGGQVTVSRAVQVHGSGASISLEAGATLSASSGFVASALIFGGLGTQIFNLEGRIETRGANPVEVIVDATDGDDIISLNNTTRFTTGAFATLTPTYLLDGGNDFDRLYLDNIDSTLRFDSRRIEELIVDPGTGGGVSRIYGTHEFQEVRVVNGQLDVFGAAAFGATASLVDIQGNSRIRFFDTGSGALTQRFTGSGTFEYHGGTHEFASANSLSGQFLLVGGTPIISHSNAFGTATVTNFANVILRDVSIANALGGNGNYIIDGTATSLSGINRMNGTITVQSGRLLVTDVANLANGQVSTPAAIVIGAQGSLNLNLQSNGILANALSGTGVLNKSSSGNLTINRSNSAFSGAVNILGGRVFLSASNALGTGAIRFSGGVVDFTNTSDIIIANAITSAPGATAVFEKNGSGRTTLTGNNSGMTALFALNQGVIAVNSVTGFGTGGNATLGGSAGLEITNAADETLGLRISNVIPSVGTFRKLGAGRLTIADLFQVGTLAVDAGSLRVNQTITAANATIASGAKLDGTGRIIGNLTNNGTVAPGNSIGTLTVQGNYVHNANSILEVEFDGSGGIDLLAVTGTATLNGGTLRFVSLGGAEGTGGTFLTAGGGVTGTFANVQTVGAQLPLAVIYQTNSAIMAPSVLTARPSTFNAQFLAAAETAFAFTDSVEAASNSRDRALWLHGFGSTGRRSASGTTLGYGHDSYGMSGGITLRVGQDSVVGAAIGWSTGDIKLASNGGGGKQDALLGSLYGSHHGDGFTLTAGLFAGKLNQETLRNVSFNGFAASVDGNTDSKLYGGHIGLSADIAKTGDWTFLAKARASYVHQSQDAYTESGTSPLRLTLPKLNANTIEAQAGLGAVYDFGSERSPSELRFDLGARLLSATGSREIPVAFAASNAGVTLQGDKRDGIHGYASAEVRHSLSEKVTLTLGYAGHVGTADRHEGRIGIRVGL